MRTALHSDGFVLARTNYGEYDRILTILTKDCGKVRAMAKGVRKERSKLAGGIELFCSSNYGFIESRGDLAVLVASRLNKFYGHLTSDINRVNYAYAVLKKINKITEQRVDASYYDLTSDLFEALDDLEISLEFIELWWLVSLVNLTGHTINVIKPIDAEVFSADQNYAFIGELGGFKTLPDGLYGADHIKFIKVASANRPKTLSRVKGGRQIANDLIPTIRSFVEYVH